MKTGQVIKTTSLTAHYDNLTGIQRETWNTRRGHRFVVLLLGTESQSDEKAFDPEEALNQMGWFRKKARKK